MSKTIPSYSLNLITGASRNRLEFDEGFVHFKSGTPIEYRTPFLLKGGQNLSKYKTYVFVDKKHNTLNLRINEIPNTLHKILAQIGLIKRKNIKKFDLLPNKSLVHKQLSEFISTDAINLFMENAGFKKKIAKKAMKVLNILF